MLLALMRYLWGYVKFEIIGKFPERFINLCSRGGLAVWRPIPTSSGICAFMYAGDYKKIRALARRSSVRARIRRRVGLPFVLRGFRGRAGLLVGAVFGAALCLFLSNFVWSVKILGAETISETYISSVLAQQGVTPGAWKASLDLDAVERDVIRACPDIRWLSLNTSGSLITAEVREGTQKPEIDSSSQPCNVKASKDGVITKVEALLGTPSVKAGSGVAKGELLVSGITESKQGDLSFVRARANVYANVAETVSSNLAKKQTYYSLSENYTDRSRLRILWLDFPCSASFINFENCVTTSSSKSLQLNGVVLPVSVSVQTQREITAQSAVLSKAAAVGKTEADCLLYEIFERGEATLVSRNISVKENSDSYTCTCDYVFNENIAEQVDFEVTD